MLVIKMLRYFAYGSNMYSPRLRCRVPGCAVIAIARLPVMRGAEEHAPPADYVARHIESVAAMDDPDLKRDRGERSKLRFW